VNRRTTRAEQDAYKRGYGKGYTRRADQWPEHRPPIPPEPVVAELMLALRALRDEADYMCATLDPGDEFEQRLGPRIDAADEAMRKVSTWLRSGGAT